MLIRDEMPRDIPAIRQTISDAMQLLPQATGTEAAIVDRLRQDGALAVSLVADEGAGVIGHLAVSAARIGVQQGWGLIGPLAVRPARHRQGIGTALMNAALDRLRQAGWRGAALVGEPGYYGRFGFAAFAGVTVTGCPPQYVLVKPFGPEAPAGELIHAAAFGLHQPG